MSLAERGYAMLALLVALVVMGILLGAALPMYSTLARREREAELIFRGEQYARAIRLYRERYGVFPPDVEALVSGGFLRRPYLDPVTGAAFRTLSPRAAGLSGSWTPVGSGGRTVFRRVEGVGDESAHYVRDTQVTLVVLAEETGSPLSGIGGVVSASSRESLRRYNGRDHYDQWVFSGG